MTGNPNRARDGTAVANSVAGEKPGHSVRKRAIAELRRFAIMFLYLYVILGLFVLHESVILAQRGINFSPYGLAVVNALILAKVMLVAEDMHLGRRFEDQPLIYPILIKSLIFATVFICFHVVEHAVTGLWHGKTIIESIPRFGGKGIDGLLTVGVIMSIALIPFFTLSEISREAGSAALKTLMFKRGIKHIVVTVELPPRHEAGGRGG